MIAKAFTIAKTFRAHSANFLRQDQGLRDLSHISGWLLLLVKREGRVSVRCLATARRLVSPRAWPPRAPPGSHASLRTRFHRVAGPASYQL